MRRARWMLLLSVAVLPLVSCDRDRVETPEDTPDTQPPTVTACLPADGANDISLLQPFTVTFSEPMDPVTLTTQTVACGPGTQAYSLEKSPDGRFVTVYPDSFWPPLQSLSLTLEGATDRAGNALVAHAIQATTGALDCDHLADAFEPNNTIATATPVVIDSLYRRLCVCDGDDDRFRVTIDDTLKLTARTEQASGQGSWMVYWIDDQERQYGTRGTDCGAGESDAFRHTFLPGTYYLWLWNYDTPSSVVYDLAIESSAPCTDDAYEDNDFDDQARPLAAGLHEGLRACYLDEDWYSVPVLAGQTITFTVDTGSYTYLRRMHIGPPMTDHITETTHDEAVSTISTTSLGSGNALLYMQVWEDDVDYSMTIAVTD